MLQNLMYTTTLTSFTFKRSTNSPPKNSPAAIKTARLDIRKDTEVPAPFVSQYRRSLDSFLQGVFDIGIDS